MRKETKALPILPACLLVVGRPCLVVGGGQVAARKVGHLLDAGAAVTVVTKSAIAPLRALARTGQIRIIKRAFSESDVGGKSLVFAATNSERVNRRVLAACRRHNVLCNASDSNWPEGDFVTPAIARTKDFVVAVSTGGRSCRQAMIARDKITRVLDSMTCQHI